MEQLILDGYKKATSAETLGTGAMNPIITDIRALFQASYYTPQGNDY